MAIALLISISRWTPAQFIIFLITTSATASPKKAFDSSGASEKISRRGPVGKAPSVGTHPNLREASEGRPKMNLILLLSRFPSKPMREPESEGAPFVVRKNRPLLETLFFLKGMPRLVMPGPTSPCGDQRPAPSSPGVPAIPGDFLFGKVPWLSKVPDENSGPATPTDFRNIHVAAG